MFENHPVEYMSRAQTWSFTKAQYERSIKIIPMAKGQQGRLALSVMNDAETRKVNATLEDVFSSLYVYLKFIKLPKTKFIQHCFERVFKIPSDVDAHQFSMPNGELLFVYRRDSRFSISELVSALHQHEILKGIHNGNDVPLEKHYHDYPELVKKLDIGLFEKLKSGGAINPGSSRGTSTVSPFVGMAKEETFNAQSIPKRTTIFDTQNQGQGKETPFGEEWDSQSTRVNQVHAAAANNAVTNIEKLKSQIIEKALNSGIGLQPGLTPEECDVPGGPPTQNKITPTTRIYAPPSVAANTGTGSTDSSLDGSSRDQPSPVGTAPSPSVNPSVNTGSNTYFAQSNGNKKTLGEYQESNDSGISTRNSGGFANDATEALPQSNSKAQYLSQPGPVVSVPVNATPVSINQQPNHGGSSLSLDDVLMGITSQAFEEYKGDKKTQANPVASDIQDNGLSNATPNSKKNHPNVTESNFFGTTEEENPKAAIDHATEHTASRPNGAQDSAPWDTMDGKAGSLANLAPPEAKRIVQTKHQSGFAANKSSIPSASDMDETGEIEAGVQSKILDAIKRSGATVDPDVFKKPSVRSKEDFQESDIPSGRTLQEIESHMAKQKAMQMPDIESALPEVAAIDPYLGMSGLRNSAPGVLHPTKSMIVPEEFEEEPFIGGGKAQSMMVSDDDHVDYEEEDQIPELGSESGSTG